ncbi:hypothetical protein TW95_gp1040 [Pandoravirus inopinatum]|uniref:Uncharacterized protein n=1 Tax=Pandoravirus inopinatum TaxID=1605721 RepID=A0A0B5J2J4_9VIRU|nr:hypothetical protein TW95_gp1040 [Pandoravirus inopinatum]AJF97774.1 hypothetical protein [Pandoravirus inopinatum]
MAPGLCAMVRASSILAWRPHNDPATFVAFCLSSAGCTRDALSAPARPLCRRDVLLGLVASGDTALVDYALDDLAQCLAPRPMPPANCISAACVCIGHGRDGDTNCSRRHRTTCLYNRNDEGNQTDQNNVVDTAFYHRATGLAMRVGGIHLLHRIMLCLDGFDPLRHIDPVDVISTDCVGALALIDPPSGAFWREAMPSHCAPLPCLPSGVRRAAPTLPPSLCVCWTTPPTRTHRQLLHTPTTPTIHVLVCLYYVCLCLVPCEVHVQRWPRAQPLFMATHAS